MVSTHALVTHIVVSGGAGTSSANRMTIGTTQVSPGRCPVWRYVAHGTEPEMSAASSSSTASAIASTCRSDTRRQ